LGKTCRHETRHKQEKARSPSGSIFSHTHLYAHRFPPFMEIGYAPIQLVTFTARTDNFYAASPLIISISECKRTSRVVTQGP
jgi:hypothetical protein